MAAGAHAPGSAESTAPITGDPVTFGVGTVAKAAFPPSFEPLVFDVVTYPAREPVTVTVMWAPRSADTTVYVLALAPEIALPLRFHWYEKVGFGDHAPGCAVNRAPKTGWPEITGVGTDENAAFLTLRAALVREVLTYPDRLPVTVTATFLPASAATILYDFDLAPEIGLPLRNH